MPQPILNVVKKPSIKLNSRTMSERPDVAAAVAQCIANWSWVELQIASLFVCLLGTKSMVAGATLYNDMDSARVKDRALRAVALSILSPDECKLLDALLAVVKTHQKTRDKLAHWYWGVCTQIKDGLVIVDPRYIVSLRPQGEQLAREGKPLPNDARQFFDFSEFFVYRLPELKAEAERFAELALFIGRFITFARQMSPAVRDQLRLELSCGALIQEALRRQSEGQNKSSIDT